MSKIIRKLTGLFIFCIILITIAAAVTVKLFPFDYFDKVQKECEQYGTDPLLIMALIKAESNFDKNITSKKDARGLMQITPETAEWCAKKMNLEDFDISMLYTPETNIKIGVWYINYLTEHFNGNTTSAIAAYNAGIGNVIQWLQTEEHTTDGENLTSIPFGETDNYVKKVINYRKIYSYIYKFKGAMGNESTI